MRKRLFSALAIFCLGSANATVFEDLDTHKLITCQFSSISQNRVVVEGSRIKKVIFPGEGLSVSLEEESGQVFVYALTPNPKTTTISIVTDHGVVQDLELNFKEKSTEVLVLKTPKEIQQETHKTSDPVSTLKTLLDGNVPCGYVSCDVSHTKKHMMRSRIELDLVGKFVGERDTLYLWQAKNCNRRSIRVSEKYFNFQEGSWVYLDKHKLKPKEKTFFVVSVT